MNINERNDAVASENQAEYCKKPVPAVGSTWAHRNGIIYRVQAVANLDPSRQDEYPITILYVNIITGSLHARTLEKWYKTNSLKEISLPER